MSTEPCRHCGRDTGAGTALFAGRVRILAHTTAYVCPSCLDEHPLRDERGIVLTKERLAAMSYTLPQGSGIG